MTSFCTSIKEKEKNELTLEARTETVIKNLTETHLEHRENCSQL